MEQKCYELSPIDFGWESLSSVDEAAGNLRRLGMKGYQGYHDQARDLERAFEEAKTLARARGWEGDFSAGPKVFWLPHEDSMSMLPGFIWKQSNNGITYVVSPLPLPWLR